MLVDRALLALAFSGALVWQVAVTRSEVPRIAVGAKVAAIAPLALLAARRRREVAGAAGLAGALTAHSAGDLLIEVAPFGLAVAAFGLGQLGYAALFWHEREAWDDVRGGAKLTLGGLALAGAATLAFLGPRLPAPLAVVVPLYAICLLAMAATAQLCRRGRPWLALGALCYVASDALLGLRLFAGTFAGSSAFVWPLYCAAQLCIALGWLYVRPEPRSVVAHSDL